MIENLQKDVKFYQEILKISHVQSAVIDISNQEKWKLPIAMYCRAIELTEAINNLDQNGQINAGTILCRSLFELHVDFLLCLSDLNYLNQMRRNELPGEIEMEKSFEDSQILVDLESELEELKENGYSKINIQQKFKKLESIPNWSNLYDGHYRSLCIETHNSSRSLISAHIDDSESEIKFGRGVGMSSGKFSVTRKQVALTLGMMSRLIHNLLCTGRSNKFDAVIKKYK